MRVNAELPGDLTGRLAVVCHDAGAANLVLGWIGRDIQIPIQAYMEGPAATAWQAAFPDCSLSGSIDEALAGATMVLSGTGWATDVEHDARLLAAQRGMFSVAVVDHWVNYAARFERRGVRVLPDAIVVTDRWAYSRAADCFSQTPVKLWPNRYLEQQIAEITPPDIDGDILYICEPARDDWGKGRPGEFQAIDFFIDHIQKAIPSENRRLRFRPHPSENPEKYKTIVESLAYAELDQLKSLAASISRSAMVGGMGSAAMVVALASGRPVFSSLPPWAPSCPLPQDGIIHLRDMV